MVSFGSRRSLRCSGLAWFVVSVAGGACSQTAQAPAAVATAGVGVGSAGVIAPASAGAAGSTGAPGQGRGLAGSVAPSVGEGAAGVRAGAAGAVSVMPAAGTAASAGSAAAAGVAGAAAASSGAAGTAAAGSGVAGSGASASAAGASAAGSAAPATGTGKVFRECRFHFGTIADVVRKNPAAVRELDFFTPGWMGLKDTFDMQHVCDDTKPGGTFEQQVPAIVAYVSAFYAKRTDNLEDCNVPGATRTLCQTGSQIIKRDLSKIVGVYESYAQGFAQCYGTTRPIIFMMEPDFYQYTVETQSQPWTAAEAGKIMTQFVMAIKKHLPNAVFSLDISPWVKPNNGEDHGMQWYSNFDLSLFTFVNTSGGGTDASTPTIRGSNKMTWRGVSQVTGKPILADTGYGVNGASAGLDPAWNNPTNINARIDDGVVSISQYNPNDQWGMTVSELRAKLKQPKVCP